MFHNKYPFANHHIVGLISKRHLRNIGEFTQDMFVDLFELTKEYIDDFSLYAHNVYFNMNFSPFAGASQDHPHVQIFIEKRRVNLHDMIETNISLIDGWLNEHNEKGLVIEYRKKIKFILNYVPLGEYNVTFLLENKSLWNHLEEVSYSIVKVLSFYDSLKESAFNFVIFPTSIGIFGTFVTRPVSPSFVSDCGFMEFIYGEKVINTDPLIWKDDFEVIVR